MKSKRVLIAAILGIATSSLFQNCSNTNFSVGTENSTQTPSGISAPGGSGTFVVDSNGTPLGESFVDVNQGLTGGHFDLDTSRINYPLRAGRTDHHVHEYDDKYGVTYADYFNLKDSKFDNINEAVGASARFILVIANAQLSPSATIEINGQLMSAAAYQNAVKSYLAGNMAALQVFTLDGASGQKLTSLRIGFPQGALSNGGLIGTETSCVVRNDPGRLGEYRNGALTIQAIDVNTIKMDPALGVAQVGGGMLWESTIFWHHDGGCY